MTGVTVLHSENHAWLTHVNAKMTSRSVICSFSLIESDVILPFMDSKFEMNLLIV